MKYESSALGKIHNKALVSKNECFFVGFIEGVVADRRVHEAEVEPLVAECAAICRQTHDDDAAELIAEASAGHLNTIDELLDLMKLIIEVRLDRIDSTCRRSSANRLLGFCAGVNCDGQITTEEAKTLLARLREDHDLAGDPRISALDLRLSDSLEDEAVEPNESGEISSLITMLVGDSYSDTGIPSTDSVPVIHDLDQIDESSVDGQKFVLTGTFQRGPRNEITAKLQEIGGIAQARPTKETDLVIIGALGSAYYTHKHHGGKLARAFELRSGATVPRIYVEGQFRALLS